VYSFEIYNSFFNLPNSVLNLIGEEEFISLDFLLSMEKSNSIGLNTGWIAKPLVVSENEKVVGFVPMFFKYHSYGEYVFDWSWAEAHESLGEPYFPKIFIGLPFTPVNSRKFFVYSEDLIEKIIIYLESFAKENKLSSIHYVFSGDLDDANKYLELRGWSKRKTIQYLWTNKNYNDFDAFLATFKNDKRKKIKQDRKKLSIKNIQFESLTGDQLNEDQIKFFYKCYEQTYLNHGSFPYIKKDFFSEYFFKKPERVVLFIGSDHAGPIGCSFCIKVGNSLYGRYWGSLEYIPSLHFELSYYQGIEYCINNNIEKFYAGIQGEHKLARGFEPIFSHSYHFLTNTQFKRAIEDFANREDALNNKYIDELKERAPFKGSSV
jgi:predicted N-acyltransferase